MDIHDLFPSLIFRSMFSQDSIQQLLYHVQKNTNDTKIQKPCIGPCPKKNLRFQAKHKILNNARKPEGTGHTNKTFSMRFLYLPTVTLQTWSDQTNKTVIWDGMNTGHLSRLRYCIYMLFFFFFFSSTYNFVLVTCKSVLQTP